MVDALKRPDDRRSMGRVDRIPKVTEMVADMIRKKIVTGVLREGEYLSPEAELAIELGVSRPTLREALRVLESEALIKPRRGSRTGAEVRAPSSELCSRYMGFVLQYEGATVDEVYSARLAIEPPLAGLLASRMTDDAKAELLEILELESSLLNDRVGYGHAATNFHERVAALSGNKTLALCSHQINWIIHRVAAEPGQVYTPLGDSRAGRERSHQDHLHLLHLMSIGDAEAAEKSWRSHLDRIGNLMLTNEMRRRVVDLFF